MRTLFLPLRSSVEMFPNPASVDATTRAKEAAILYEHVVVEAGLFQIDILGDGFFSSWLPPGHLTQDKIARSREMPPPGSGVQISIGFEETPGEPAPPEAMHSFLSGPLSARYVAEWHSGVISQLGDREWVQFVITDDHQPPMTQLKPTIDALERELKALRLGDDQEPLVQGFAASALARDAVVAGSIGAAFSVTSLFEPLLSALDARPVVTGASALRLLVPDLTAMPWEAVEEWRTHPACEEARGRLREFEHRALTAEPDDPLAFHMELFRAITRDLFRSIAELQGSVAKDLAQEAVKTGLSFIPVIGPFMGPGASVVQALPEGFREQQSWYAALMRLERRS